VADGAGGGVELDDGGAIGDGGAGLGGASPDVVPGDEGGGEGI
jgi:hypothetical protein